MLEHAEPLPALEAHLVHPLEGARLVTRLAF
jgi:hypothetical protein